MVTYVDRPNVVHIHIDIRYSRSCELHSHRIIMDCYFKPINTNAWPLDRVRGQYRRHCYILGSAQHCPDSIRGIPRTYIEMGGNKQSALENFEDVYIIDLRLKQ
jgi:hypothetical protein